MKTGTKSIYFLAGCAAAVTLFTSLGLTSPEHQDPAHATENTKPKVVKAVPKVTHSETKTESKTGIKSQGSHIETLPAEIDHAAKPVKATKHAAVVETDTEVTAEDALAKLVEGNERWVSDHESNPRTEATRREMLADKGQKPFVTILTCADSRIPVERVFDQGVGDVFVVRVAGNVAGVNETGTIEYGAGHLHTPLLVVMGHTKCGAVGAAASGAALHGMVGKLVGNIQPAVDRAKRNNPGIDDQELATISVKENVWQSVFDLYKNSDELRELVASGKLKVVGAVYDISTGKVDFLGEHPWQGELLGALKARTDTATAGAEKH